MRLQKLLAVAAVALSAAAFPALGSAQISINIGGPPVCPYGYYGYAPYNCAPYGYYGPQWFNGGVFIGAGRWFHGPAHFHGYVNNHYDPHHGYHGPFPQRNEHAFSHGEDRSYHNFHGNEGRDGHGHVIDHGDHHGH